MKNTCDECGQKGCGHKKLEAQERQKKYIDMCKARGKAISGIQRKASRYEEAIKLRKSPAKAVLQEQLWKQLGIDLDEDNFKLDDFIDEAVDSFDNGELSDASDLLRMYQEALIEEIAGLK